MTHAYQQFETLQRCGACSEGVIPAEPPRVCPNCGAVYACPRIEDWPPRFVTFLCRRMIRQWFKPFESMTRQQQLEQLLRAVFRGTTVNGHVIPRSATANEVWPLARAEYDRWIATSAGATSEDLA